jgi:phage host-nuclease inhibitor protein Gam
MAGEVTAGKVDRELRRIGELELRIQDIEAEMLREMDEVKERYGRDLAPLRARKAQAEEALLDICKAGREELFHDATQTVKGAFGSVSFRATPSKLARLPGVTEEQAAGRLPPKLHKFLRMRQSVDMARLRMAVVQGEVKEPELEKMGLRLLPGEESWQVKTDKEAVREAVGQP